ncbi:MAG: TetR/AcrR family transcriptional regulator [Actinomycetaceae bacterium]|nr:TetR/AcrR family transcriptional regulator [Actinomycetaceae bacterium]
MPKISGSTLEEHRENTRAALFRALSSLLREQSFESITMTQIARRAGVGRTAVYNHFGDKESLLFALMSTMTEQFTQTLAEALSHTDDPLERLRIYIRAQLELKQHFHLSEGVNLRNLVRTQPAEKVRAHVQVVEHILQHLLAQAHAAKIITEPPTPLTMLMIHSALTGPALPHEPKQRQQVLDHVEAFILRGLGASETALEQAPDGMEKLDFGFPVEEIDADSLNTATYARCPINVVV